MSKRILFTDGWLFHDGEIETGPPAVKGPVYTQAKTEGYRRGPAAIAYLDRPDDYGRAGRELTYEKWSKITLPHDYIIDGEPKERNNNALGFFDYRPAWYRKHFELDEGYRGKRIELEFCGVATSCEVYLNGVLLARHYSAFTPFTVDITDFACFDGENVLAVRVSNDRFEGWWYQGGGIYRKVWLSVKEPVSVKRYGVYVSPEHVGGSLWRVPVEVTAENMSYESVTAEARVTLLDKEGTETASASVTVSIDARSESKAVLGMEVNDPHLWDVDDPVLYTARTELFANGRLVDTVNDTFGFRYFRFDPNKGFFLNGRPLFINGVCCHEDFSLTGKAIPDNVMRHRVRLIKEMGANGVRCSHYMFDEEMMNAFDRQGILVMAETRHFSSAREHVEELRTLILRDRNRPSVILWSIGNEEHYFVKEQGERIAAHLRAEVLKHDKTRPILTANDKTPDQCTVYGVSDIVGINYNLPIYETVRKQIPDKAFVSTECCATGSTRGWYHEDSPEKGYLSAYDKDTNLWFRGREYTYRFLRSYPYVAGAFQWIAFEHRGEATWPRICSQSGAIDLFLQKKDAFYQNLSMWSDKPMIHLLPHWNMEGCGDDPIRVWAYTSCPAAELFLNGKSLGKQQIERYGHAEWLVPFEKGELSVLGYDTDGKAVASDRKVTAGKSVSLALRLENPDDLRANGEDIALYTCYCTDADGNEVPTAAPTVSFSANGLGRIVGTGSDVADHTPVPLTVRRMRAGRILVGVKVGTTAGKLRLYAECDGLASCTHEIWLSDSISE